MVPTSNVALELSRDRALLTILIVDDDPGILNTLRSLLQGMGHTVLVTSDAFDAYTILMRSQIDLLIVDMRMPQISGLELIKKVKAIKPQVSAILMTAYDSPQIAKEARAIDGVQYVAKPFTHEQLKELIQKTQR